ncbi:MAG: flagellar basal-body rod protein FlgF [Hyphomicrobiales bacterium]|nr:MAG: flagellar basal-body rod protein FlgF [Hyphomicrobiales bacterium]
MDNAVLIGLSQQMALRNQMTVIANNLANVNTAGFKSGRLLFEEYLMPASADNLPGTADTKLSYVQDGAILRDFVAGRMQRTDNPLDVAVGGKGWMVVQTDAGERFTRNGNLSLRNDGTLITSAGHPVLTDGGPILIGQDETDITIADDGTVSTSAGVKGRLRLVEFENEQSLQKEGDSLYSSSDQPKPAERPRFVQGMVEGSNVQPVVEMTHMIEVQRAYTRTASIIQRQDELMSNTINKLGQAPS